MNNVRNRYSVPPDTIAAIIIVAISILLLSYFQNVSAESASFPKAILYSMVALGIVLGIRGLVSTRHAASTKSLITDRGQFFRVVGLIGVYAISVDTIGFYSSTIIMLPATAFLFGYRQVRRILLTTIVLVGALFVIFTLTMGRSFPTEFFLR